MFASLRPAALSGVRAFSTSRVAARDLAKMTLVGRIGGVDIREGKNGQQYLTYKVATTDKGRPPKEGEEYVRPPTSWHTIFAHGGAVERLQFLEKGSLVYVEAEFSVRNVKDETTGAYSTQILATHDRLTVLKKPTAREEAPADTPAE
ncbi:Rim1p [Rhodotorula paludigena]|uniref:Rim1p n=1 Tax=Rhodotorula paludigena TaxID=86838 RepID=UPI0031805048